jgi:hypothetical protein
MMETKYKMAAIAAILDEHWCWLSKAANPHKKFQVDPQPSLRWDDDGHKACQHNDLSAEVGHKIFSIFLPSK